MKSKMILGLVLSLLIIAPALVQGDAKTKTVENYIHALQNGDSKAKCNAAWELGKSGDPKAIDPLMSALQSPDSNVRDWAVLALVKIGNASVNPLVQALQDGGKGNAESSHNASLVRQEAAAALGLINDSRAGEKLMDALATSNDDSTRYWAAVSLGMISEPKATSLLVRTLADKNASIRGGARWALRAIEGPRAEDILIGLLRDNNSSICSGAAEALGDIPDAAAVEPLIDVLDDKSGRVRAKAIESLGKINDNSAIEPLIGMLRDNESEVRAAAVRSLTKMGRQVSSSLILALKNNDKAIQLGAATILGDVGDDGAINPLVEAFKGGVPDVRHAAGKSLAKINKSNSVEPFLQILKEENQSSEIRADAAWALGLMGDARAKDLLLQVMGNDKDSNVRLCAARALKNIGHMQMHNKPLYNYM